MHPVSVPCRARARRTRGSIYLTTLATAALLSSIGMAALVTARIETRRRSLSAQTNQAAALAEAGIDLALHEIAADPDFRTNILHGQWQPDLPLKPGLVRWQLLDGDSDAASDGDLADDTTEPFRVLSWGLTGDAVQKRVVVVDVDGSQLQIRPGSWAKAVD